jgi:Flp pilus assembly protein TadD
MFGIKIKFEKEPDAPVVPQEAVDGPQAEQAIEAEDMISSGAGKVWEKISKWALYALVFLIPIFFLPWGVSQVAQNKEYLATVLLSVAFIAWLAKSIASGRLIWAKTILNVAALVFLVVWGIASLFSMSKLKSLGFSGIDPDSFSSVLKYVLAFFLISATFRNKKDLERAALLFFASLALVAIAAALKFFGANIFPWDFAKGVEFNTIGEIGSLALFLGFGLAMIISLFVVGGVEDLAKSVSREAGDTPEGVKSSGIQKIVKPGLIALAVVLAAELLLINFSAAWWTLAGVMLFLVAYGFTREVHGIKSGKNKVFRIQHLSLPIAILVFSVVIILANIFLQNGLPSNKLVNLPVEFGLSNSATYNVAKSVWGKSGDMMIGSGPSTFTYDYGLYKPTDINSTIFWGVRFPQGSSLFLSSMATAGFLGLLSVLFLMAAFVWQAVKAFSLKNDQADGGAESSGNSLQVPALVATLFFLIAWFLYSANFALLMMGFIGLAFFVASRSSAASNTEPASDENGKKGFLREISLLASPQRTLIISLVLIIMMVATVSFFYLETQRYIASIYFSSGVNGYSKDGNADTAVAKINKAIGLDSLSDQYVRTASQSYLVLTNNVLNDPKWQNADAATADDLRSQFQTFMAQAVGYAKKAAELEPAESANWSNLGYTYENILAFANGAEQYMIDAYQKAAALEPANPAMAVDLGRAHLLAYDKMQSQIAQIKQGKTPDENQIKTLGDQSAAELSASQKELQRAVDLKSDYSPAHYLLVQVYSRQGDLKNAIARSIDYYNLNPKDAGAAFQLGFLFYKDNQMDNAKSALEMAVSLSDDYSNARYFLGLIYDAQGNKDSAKEQFNKIASLNPDNAEVKKILDNLNAGRGALEEVAPPATPPENRTQAPVQETGQPAGQALQPPAQQQPQAPAPPAQTPPAGQ